MVREKSLDDDDIRFRGVAGERGGSLVVMWETGSTRRVGLMDRTASWVRVSKIVLRQRLKDIKDDH